MRFLHRAWFALGWVALVGAPALAQPPSGPDTFVPIKDLPEAEKLPAAPYLVVAYAFVWVALMFYVWTIWRRLNRVETEMRALAQKTARR